MNPDDNVGTAPPLTPLSCVQIDDIDTPRAMPLRLPRNLRVRVYAAKYMSPAKKNDYDQLPKGLLNCQETQPFFEEVGLVGKSESDLVDGNCLFTSLKFRTTSFNHSGSLFHLIIVVYAVNQS